MEHRQGQQQNRREGKKENRLVAGEGGSDEFVVLLARPEPREKKGLRMVEHCRDDEPVGPSTGAKLREKRDEGGLGIG